MPLQLQAEGFQGFGVQPQGELGNGLVPRSIPPQDGAHLLQSVQVYSSELRELARSRLGKLFSQSTMEWICQGV